MWRKLLAHGVVGMLKEIRKGVHIGNLGLLFFQSTDFRQNIENARAIHPLCQVTHFVII